MHSDVFLPLTQELGFLRDCNVDKPWDFLQRALLTINHEVGSDDTSNHCDNTLDYEDCQIVRLEDGSLRIRVAMGKESNS